MKTRTLSTIALLFALVQTTICTSSASVDEASIEADLEAAINTALDIIFEEQETEDLVDKRDRILAHLDATFPLDVVVRGAFGRNWKKFTPEQQKELITLTSDLILNIYSRDFSQAQRPEMSFGKHTQLTASKIEIPSIVKLGDISVNLTYRLANLKEKGWQIYDVLVEGRSMVQNYRAQFDEHFQKKNAEDLLDRLRNKLVKYK